MNNEMLKNAIKKAINKKKNLTLANEHYIVVLKYFSLTNFTNYSLITEGFEVYFGLLDGMLEKQYYKDKLEINDIVTFLNELKINKAV